MNLQIVFKTIDHLDGKETTFSKSFTKVSEEIGDEGLRTFADAYSTLVDNDDYDLFKITKEEL